MEDELIEIVTMLTGNKTIGDAHDDVQFEGIGGDVPPHVHKIYKPGGHPQTDIEEHRPTMTMMEVETVRPQVTGNIELIEVQLVYQKRTEDGGLPEPVRPPSGPAWSPLPPPHQGTDSRLVGDPELSRWTPGETPIEPGEIDWGTAMTELGKVDDS